MKIWHLLLIILLTCSFSATESIPADQIEGSWHNAENQIGVMIETTPEGIRVKRMDQNNWHRYETIRDHQYRNKNGSGYTLIDDQTIEWEGKMGQKRLRFKKRNSGNQSFDQQRSRTPQNNRNRYSRGQRYHDSSPRSVYRNAKNLRGRWMNSSTGQHILIQSRRSNILRVKAHRGGWSTFFRTDSNTFKDERGNRYDVLNRSLIYRSSNGDFEMRFMRE